MEQKGIKLSIITVNLNNAKGLSKTIDSVLEQLNPDAEFLIIDGGSVDQSLTMIKEVAHKLSYWISEKDSGIYAAMNKGIEKAKGNHWLNSTPRWLMILIFFLVAFVWNEIVSWMNSGLQLQNFLYKIF